MRNERRNSILKVSASDFELIQKQTRSDSLSVWDFKLHLAGKPVVMSPDVGFSNHVFNFRTEEPHNCACAGFVYISHT